MSFIFISLALVLDQLLGEANRFHPLIGFGHCAKHVEKRLNLSTSPRNSILLGVLGLSILVLPFYLASYLITDSLSQYSWVFSVYVIYWAVGFKSLIEHSEQVADALFQRNMMQARTSVALMVSRDTTQMDESQVTSATIESTLENGCDSTFAVLFWFIVGGAPLVVLYRLSNTLDAMWGYRNQRFEYFGKPAAILDDVLNYIPAKLTAWSYALCGNTKQALYSWRTQAARLASPNGGPVMTSGAGSLNIELGGPANYHGKLIDKPYFGGLNKPNSSDISRANALLTRALLLWCAAALAIALSSALVNRMF